MDYSDACMNYPATILLIEPDNGNIVGANKKAEITYGYSIEQLCKMNINDINALKPEQIKEEVQNANSKIKNQFHFPHKTASGKIIDVEVESYPTKYHDKSIIKPFHSSLLLFCFVNFFALYSYKYLVETSYKMIQL